MSLPDAALYTIIGILNDEKKVAWKQCSAVRILITSGDNNGKQVTNPSGRLCQHYIILFNAHKLLTRVMHGRSVENIHLQARRQHKPHTPAHEARPGPREGSAKVKCLALAAAGWTPWGCASSY